MADLPFLLDEKEIGALMCGVAVDNVWRRGKRNFMICSRNMFGINLVFREKGTQIALSCPNWRIGATVNVRGQSSGGVKVKVPTLHYGLVKYVVGPSGRGTREKLPPATVIHDAMMWNPVLEIYTTQQRFERDWVLLRMFSGEWAEYGTP
jgi:hypothetical protein